MYRRWGKRLLDLLLVIPALILLMPVLALVAVLTRIALSSPVLFRQERAGLHGQAFSLYKFRSMTNARDQRGDLLPDAARLSPFGRFLRQTSLDELPQLWNVLKGDMSLVGPRPLYVRYLPYYSQRELRRHLVRPGLTGLAQVSGRNLLSWDERLELDARYVDQLALSLDLRIMLQTAAQVVTRRGILVVPGVAQGPLDQCRSGRSPGEVKVCES